MTFGWNVTEQVIEIEVLPDDERNEMREAFTVHITMDENMIAEVQVCIMGVLKRSGGVGEGRMRLVVAWKRWGLSW